MAVGVLVNEGVRHFVRRCISSGNSVVCRVEVFGMSSCTTSTALYIEGMTNPRTMWRALERELNKTTTKAGRRLLRTKFDNAAPSDGVVISPYIAEITSISRMLHNSQDSLFFSALMTCFRV